MINVIQHNDIYQIHFKYDPYIVELVKQVPGRRWDPNNKFWTIPSNHLGMLINQFKGTMFESELRIYSDEDINVNASLDSTQKIPDVDISDVTFNVKKGCQPYQHQLDFMKYGIHNDGKGFIVGDEMRLGKTIEVLNLAVHRRKTHNYKRCLIICCVNTSKYNWLEDIEKHFNGEEHGYILGTRKKKNGQLKYNMGGKEKYEDLKCGHMYGDINEPELPFFIITNIESLRTHTKARPKAKPTYTIAEEIIKMVNSGELNMIAIDEVHHNCSPQSIQGKVLIQIKEDTQSNAEWLPMTGTPIVNKPTDVYLPLKLVDGHSFKDHWSWCHYFCVYGGYGNHDIIAYKHIPELKQMLQSHMIRRLKNEVHDMPNKIQYIEYVENTSYQQKLYSKLAEQLVENEELLIEQHRMNPMTVYLRLRQVNGSPELVDDSLSVDDKSYLSKNAKLTRVLELIDETVDRGEKLIVYSNWVEPLKTLYKFVRKKHKVCCFTGTMKEEVRQKHKRVFINNPDYPIMIGTTGALGTAHTLTVATTVIFYDEPWTAVDKIQAEDRIYGLETDRPINIYTVLSKDTIDDRVHNLVYSKDAVANYIVDNKIDFKANPELFEMLIGNY